MPFKPGNKFGNRFKRGESPNPLGRPPKKMTVTYFLKWYDMHEARMLKGPQGKSIFSGLFSVEQLEKAREKYLLELFCRKFKGYIGEMS